MPDSPLETNQGYAKRECSASRTGGSIARTEPGVRGVCALEILHELLIKEGSVFCWQLHPGHIDRRQQNRIWCTSCISTNYRLNHRKRSCLCKDLLLYLRRLLRGQHEDRRMVSLMYIAILHSEEVDRLLRDGSQHSTAP
jgi:hypothetical protein